MSDIHQTVGTLVLLGFIASLVLNAVALTGRRFSWSRYVSLGAAGLLLLQVLLGFSLLGEGEDNAASHYILGIVALLSLGFEHGYARSRPTADGRSQWGAIANAVTLVVVLITYLIGQSNAS